MTAKPMKLSFQSKLERISTELQYFALPVPAKITKELGTHGPVPVKAKINDSDEFLVSLYPVGGGQHYIRIKAQIRKQTEIKEGDRVKVQITVIDAKADVEIPKDVAAALKKAGLLQAFKSRPPGEKRFSIRKIDEASKPETRVKRIETLVKEIHGKA